LNEGCECSACTSTGHTEENVGIVYKIVLGDRWKYDVGDCW